MHTITPCCFHNHSATLTALDSLPEYTYVRYSYSCSKHFFFLYSVAFLLLSLCPIYLSICQVFVILLSPTPPKKKAKLLPPPLFPPTPKHEFIFSFSRRKYFHYLNLLALPIFLTFPILSFSHSLTLPFFYTLSFSSLSHFITPPSVGSPA